MKRMNQRQINEANEALVTYADDYHLEDQIGYILRKAHQRASEIFFTIMQEYGFSPTQFSTLIKLHDFRETSQNRLGRLVAMDPATTLGVVSRLKKQGLIAQRNDPRDRRRLLLRLTPEGLDKVETMRKVAKRVSDETLKALNPAEQQSLQQLLRKIS